MREITTESYQLHFPLQRCLEGPEGVLGACWVLRQRSGKARDDDAGHFGAEWKAQSDKGPTFFSARNQEGQWQVPRVPTSGIKMGHKQGRGQDLRRRWADGLAKFDSCLYILLICQVSIPVRFWFRILFGLLRTLFCGKS